MKPTVGRMVQYVPKAGGPVLAAVVVAVPEEGDAVELKVFWPRTVIEEPWDELLTPHAESPAPGHWHWPVIR